MPEGIPSISSIIGDLPHKLQLRFDSLGSLVAGIIDEESSKPGANIELSRENIQLVQLAALVYSLDSFFRAGSSSARTAAVTFEEFGLSGFQVGRTVFTRENDNTRRGDVLANQLQETIMSSYLGTTIRNANTMKDLILTMIREMNNGQSMDQFR